MCATLYPAALLNLLSATGFLTDDLSGGGRPPYVAPLGSNSQASTGASASGSPATPAGDKGGSQASRAHTPHQPRLRHSCECDSYMGVCRLPGAGHLHRRIDLKAYPRHQFPFAVLYFTGESACMVHLCSANMGHRCDCYRLGSL